MEFTGERFVPGTAGRMKLEHLQRYALCRGLVRGKRVLDIATGEGYGAAMLCGPASRVIGVDVAADAILHARAKYRAANVHFVVGACEAIPLAAGSIDVIVSFETIEHLVDHDAMMREFRRVLAPGGLAGRSVALVEVTGDTLEPRDRLIDLVGNFGHLLSIGVSGDTLLSSFA